MNINFLNQSGEASWNNYRKYLKPLLEKTLGCVGYEGDVEVGVVLVDAATIHEYNNNYRSVDRPTDVLSFVDGELSDGVVSLGDIIISVEAIRSQAKEYGHSLKREFCFLVVHGYLHLLGYDHQSKEEEETMTRIQEDVLDGIANRNS